MIACSHPDGLRAADEHSQYVVALAYSYLDGQSFLIRKSIWPHNGTPTSQGATRTLEPVT
ncbi:MAG: hypothetical protein OEU32_06460 [Acidimicrobiia bacterium]|nr:hypothetical protein [Acidimicrobiia bacterium]